MGQIQFLLVLSCCVLSSPASALSNTSTDVLKAARSYKDGGGYNKEFKGSGTPEEILFKGKRILSKGDKTYCNGFTFAVVMKVGSEKELFKDLRVSEIRSFQQNWYGANDASKEKQCQYAMEKLGVGGAVTLDDAKAGDFVQFWRTKSGHSTVFLKWVVQGGKRIGLKYRSSQSKTAGIGDHIEYFKGIPGKSGYVDPSRIYLSRLK
ncbi:hypothetical protein [Gimesia aquarii]|uniref:Uncharacterized protein n=1 Tax=Gimesia aquarii TaxID=2527964 RepID=A0A517WWK4_9PLAN|nr:hypothetical protein [Gimesia aquarii]QDU09651.1 hypothetical protein V202x_30270 [Gimesia aquarii]